VLLDLLNILEIVEITGMEKTVDDGSKDDLAGETERVKRLGKYLIASIFVISSSLVNFSLNKDRVPYLQ